MSDEDAELEETVRRNLLAGWVPRRTSGPAVESEDLDPYERLVLEREPWLRPGELFKLGVEWFGAVRDVEEARAWLQAGAGVRDHETVRRLREVGVPAKLAGEHVRDQWRRDVGSLISVVRRGRLTPEQARQVVERNGRLPERRH